MATTMTKCADCEAMTRKQEASGATLCRHCRLLRQAELAHDMARRGNKQTAELLKLARALHPRLARRIELAAQ